MKAQKSSITVYITLALTLIGLVAAVFGINPLTDPPPELGAWALVITTIITAIGHYLTAKQPPTS